MATLTLAAGAVYLPTAIAALDLHGPGQAAPWFVGVSGGLLAAGALRITAFRRARGIGATDDIGTVIDALQDTDRDVRTAAEAALCPILASIRSNTTVKLTSQQYETVLASLPLAPKSLVVPILSALGVIGDHRADVAVAAAAQAPDVPHAVREAAQAALLAIAERGDTPSVHVSGESGFKLEAERDVAGLLSDIVSGDPGRQAEAICLAERLTPDDRDALIDGARGPITRLQARIGIQALLAAGCVVYGIPFLHHSANPGALYGLDIMVRSIFVAGLLAFSANGVVRKTRRLQTCVSDLKGASTVDDTLNREIRALLDTLQSKDVGVRARALRRMHGIERGVLMSITAGLTAEADRVGCSMRRRSFAITVLPIPLFIAVEACLYGTAWFNIGVSHVLNATFPSLLAVILAWPLLRESRKRRQILSMFALIDDPCACGSLLTALQVRDADLRKRALIALECLLPRAEVGDMEDLTDRQVAALESLLASPKPDTVKAALRALTFAGTERSLKRMAKLASDASATLPDIARYAEGCARGLRERIDAELSRGVLLRPAAAHAQREELLRPTTGGASADGATLLRGAKAPQGKARLAPNLVAHVSAAVEAEQAGTRSSARPTPISADEVEVVGVQATNSERVL